MKRLTGLYEQISSIENLELADVNAGKGKSKQPGVIEHFKNRDANLWKLHLMLVHKNYKTSPYTTFKILDPKLRLISRLPFFPDRIVHHAIMNVLEKMFISVFTADTYSCIKHLGIHAAARAVRKALKDEQGTKYCLKLDIKKFYPSIDHNILKQLLRRKIKDQDLLWLLDEIIDSNPDGIPIGNYLSQYFANFYLAWFDHWLKEIKQVKYYFRYADDMVILAGNKPYLHNLLQEITSYLGLQLNLQVKHNYQVFPVQSRSIDFIGYCFFHSHTRLRKSIKQNFARKIKSNYSQATIAAYWGWAKHCNSNNLLKKLLA